MQQHTTIPASRWAFFSFSILGRIGGDATLLGHRERPGSRSPFSILGRIGGDATICGMEVQYPATELSVSSVGSEAMQRRRAMYWIAFNPPFSILGRIGGDATFSSLRCQGWSAAKTPFSILGRIGGDATPESTSVS